MEAATQRLGNRQSQLWGQWCAPLGCSAHRQMQAGLGAWEFLGVSHGQRGLGCDAGW